jgi:HAD superfamily hydrolase (TIGR01549 family)
MSANGSGRSLAVLFDVDGTLIDSVYQHTLAWQRAFAEHGVRVPGWVLHRHIGMGGDQLVVAVAGEEVEHRLGDRIRASESERYEELIGEVQPLPGSLEMIVGLTRDGYRVSLASSAKSAELDHYLDLLELRGVLDDATSADDVERSKPDPDTIERALDRIGGPPAALVGDATWDSIAAEAAGIRSVGVTTGGFCAEELRAAGAEAVFDDLASVTAYLMGSSPSPDGSSAFQDTHPGNDPPAHMAL